MQYLRGNSEECLKVARSRIAFERLKRAARDHFDQLGLSGKSQIACERLKPGEFGQHQVVREVGSSRTACERLKPADHRPFARGTIRML